MEKLSRGRSRPLTGRLLPVLPASPWPQRANRDQGVPPSWDNLYSHEHRPNQLLGSFTPHLQGSERVEDDRVWRWSRRQRLAVDPGDDLMLEATMVLADMVGPV